MRETRHVWETVWYSPFGEAICQISESGYRSTAAVEEMFERRFIKGERVNRVRITPNLARAQKARQNRLMQKLRLD